MSSAQQQVLEVDTALLREVLACLGTDVAECRAALLVSRFWQMALEGAAPWKHLLQRYFPSMAAPGAFLAHQQREQRRHRLFRRTAKELLCLRLMDANPYIREKREVRRLKNQFRNKYVTLLVSHPGIGVVADAVIPIIQGKDCSQNILETSHPLSVHHVLPASMYEECEVTLEMPGRLTLLTNNEYEADADEVDFEEVPYPRGRRGRRRRHALTARSRYDDVRSTIPTAVMEATISVGTYYATYNSSCAFSYLKFMESWMVVAKHLRDDATESARFQSRFKETYLLVEVGLTREKNVERGIIIGRRSDVTDKPMNNTIGFALVSLVDEEALFNLFTTQSTSVQFVDRDGGSERLPPADHRVVRLSILDLGLDRVMKLGEGYFLSESYKGEDPFDSYNSTSSRNFYCFEQNSELTPSFQEVTETGGHGSKYAATVMLSVEILGFQGYSKTSHFDSVLKLWKFLEICMTGETS